MACVTSADCVELTDGCCLGSTLISFPEDGYYGDAEAMFAQTEYYPEVGFTYPQCVSASVTAAVVEGEMSAYDSLANGLAAATPEELEEQGLYGDETADDVIAIFGSDAYTFENTIFSNGCQDGAEDAAAYLVAGATAVMAVAL